MKKFLINNLILILICLLFLITRFYKIGEIPQSVYWDEASIGYNAYSILTTGKDEWGETLPLHFRAFGEFKLPVYIYSVVIAESIFGLTPLAVRIPAVIFGLFSIVGLYLLVFEITKKRETALLSSFLFAITPWFFIFSRTGYEATSGLMFFIYAIYFLIKSNKEKRLLIVSTILFLISAYSYNSFRILTPFILGPVFVYHLFKKTFIPVLISGVLVVGSIFPVYKLYRQDSGLSRFQAVGSKSGLVTNYFKNLSPNFLFVNGDSNPRSQIPKSGQLYYLDTLFLVLGILYILKTKDKKLYWILGLLVLALIPSAITKENPHALRSILASPMLSVISAMGIYYFIEIFKKNKKLVLLMIIGFYLIAFGKYFCRFINEYNNLSKSAWQYEYKEIFENQKSGCVSDEFAQPYIFALFYGKDDSGNKISPKDFISSRTLNPVSDWGFSTVKSFGNYIFSKKCLTN